MDRPDEPGVIEIEASSLARRRGNRNFLIAFAGSRSSTPHAGGRLGRRGRARRGMAPERTDAPVGAGDSHALWLAWTALRARRPRRVPRLLGAARAGRRRDDFRQAADHRRPLRTDAQSRSTTAGPTISSGPRPISSNARRGLPGPGGKRNGRRAGRLEENGRRLGAATDRRPDRHERHRGSPPPDGDLAGHGVAASLAATTTPPWTGSPRRCRLQGTSTRVRRRPGARRDTLEGARPRRAGRRGRALAAEARESFERMGAVRSLERLDACHAHRRDRVGLGQERSSSTLYAGTGRANPFSVNVPTSSASTSSSTSASVRWLIRICPPVASSQSRDARIVTAPTAA